MKKQNKDPCYHYEEMTSKSLGQYGIWDIPGSEVMVRMWPMFYRYLRMTAVFFVVDAFSASKEDLDKIAQARHQIEFLLNEDELRTAAFVLIINTGYKEGVDSADTEYEWHEFEEALK